MRHFYGLQDNKIIDRAFALSNVFFTTTGTTAGTGATAGCHEVTYNWDNKITVVNSFSLSTVVFFSDDNNDNGNNGHNG